MNNIKRARRKEVTYSPEEWEKVVKRAASVSMKPATYIKNISLKGEIKVYNYTDLYANDDELEVKSIRTYYESMWLKQGLTIKYLKFKVK